MNKMFSLAFREIILLIKKKTAILLYYSEENRCLKETEYDLVSVQICLHSGL